jgi:hypothetical protein
MKTKKNNLSSTRINWIREQGYFKQSDDKVCSLAFGNRFAFRLCASILIIGVILNNIPILTTMLLIAFLGVVLPYHPFDYIYNNLLSKQLGKPILPPRTAQLKFACGLATLWIAVTIILFYNNLTLAGYIVGFVLIGVASLVATVDFCIPSKIYNKIFSNQVNLL